MNQVRLQLGEHSSQQAAGSTYTYVGHYVRTLIVYLCANQIILNYLPVPYKDKRDVSSYRLRGVRAV